MLFYDLKMIVNKEIIKFTIDLEKDIISCFPKNFTEVNPTSELKNNYYPAYGTFKNGIPDSVGKITQESNISIDLAQRNIEAYKSVSPKIVEFMINKIKNVLCGNWDKRVFFCSVIAYDIQLKSWHIKFHFAY